jgi:hypothetical protein
MSETKAILEELREDGVIRIESGTWIDQSGRVAVFGRDRMAAAERLQRQGRIREIAIQKECAFAKSGRVLTSTTRTFEGV